MPKNFSEMSFEEIQQYRKEIVIRGSLVFIIILLAIVGLVIMTINDVSWSNRNAFRLIATAIGGGLLLVYTLPLSTKVNRVLKQHPDWVRQSALKTKVPQSWTIQRSLILGIAVLILAASFVILYNPQPEANQNYSDYPTSVPQQENQDYSGLDSLDGSSDTEEEE